jgi:DNA-binding MarR family transcriptional regulator
MTQEINVLAQDILRIIPQFVRLLAAELRRSGQLMTPGNFQLMFMLQYGPANLSELAEFQNVSLPTMSRSVARLESIGWVERHSDPNDRRVALIVLTDDGEKRLQEMGDVALKIIGEALESTSITDREALAAGLDVMRRAFDLYDTEENNERC